MTAPLTALERIKCLSECCNHGCPASDHLAALAEAVTVLQNALHAAEAEIAFLLSERLPPWGVAEAIKTNGVLVQIRDALALVDPPATKPP